MVRIALFPILLFIAIGEWQGIERLSLLIFTADRTNQLITAPVAKDLIAKSGDDGYGASGVVIFLSGHYRKNPLPGRSWG